MMRRQEEEDSDRGLHHGNPKNNDNSGSNIENVKNGENDLNAYDSSDSNNIRFHTKNATANQCTAELQTRPSLSTNNSRVKNMEICKHENIPAAKQETSRNNAGWSYIREELVSTI